MGTYRYDYTEQEETIEQDNSATRGVIVLGIDFNNGHALMSNSDLKRVSPPENLLQRILKFLHTERDRFRIYEEEFRLNGNAYGWDILEIIGHTYTSVTLPKYSAQARRFLENEYDIISVDDIELIPTEDKLLITIILTSIYGKVEIKEVLQDNYNLYVKGA